MALPFKHTYPEVQDNAMPQMYGQTLTINGVPMEKLRLRQLRDLARAFSIPLDMDAPKDRIMPALMAAANAGMFRRKPDKEYYWYRAHRTGDEKDPFEHPDFADPDAPAQPPPQKAAAVPSTGGPSLPSVPAASAGAAAAPDAFKPTLSPESMAVMQKYAHMSFPALRAAVKQVRPDVALFGVSRLDLGRLLDEAGYVAPGS